MFERAAEGSASILTEESLDDMVSMDSPSSWPRSLALSKLKPLVLGTPLVSGSEPFSFGSSSHSSSKASRLSTSASRSATARQLGHRNCGQLL